MSRQSKTSRRDAILQCLVGELENNPTSRITTAGLARAAGVSEAALYRHFPSKAKMFEALIEFAEESVFGLINRVQDEHQQVLTRCGHSLKVVLGFAGKNPGIARILAGDALAGEHERLRERVGQFYERLETQFRQQLREGAMRGELSEGAPVAAIANLFLAAAEGRMAQFVRSGFSRQPLDQWDQQWALLAQSCFGAVPHVEATPQPF